MTINWDDLLKIAQEAGFDEILPEDWYNVVAEKADAVKTAAGDDMVKVRFRVIDGPKAGAGGLYQNFVLKQHDVNPVAMGFFFRNMNALGLDQDWFKATQPTADYLASVIVGRSCRVQNVHEIYRDQKKNKISRMEALTSAQQPVIPAAPVRGPMDAVTPMNGTPVTPMPLATPQVDAFKPSMDEPPF